MTSVFRGEVTQSLKSLGAQGQASRSPPAPAVFSNCRRGRWAMPEMDEMDAEPVLSSQSPVS